MREGRDIQYEAWEEGKQGNMGGRWQLGRELELREWVRETVRGQLGELVQLGFLESL